MNKLIFSLFLLPLFLFSKDFFTIQILKTTSLEKANEVTEKYKAQGFDSFTQTRPHGRSELHLSCINKFHTHEEANVFARNLKNVKIIDSYDVTLVLSKNEWISRFIKKEKIEKRIPAETSDLNLNPENSPLRNPSSVQKYEENSFEGTPFSGPIENPVIEGQKFVSTESGLFVSIPTNNGDYWKKVPTKFNSKNALLHFAKDGTLYVNSFKLNPDQKEFIPLIDSKKYHLSTYSVNKIHEKDGLLWLYFDKVISTNAREPASMPTNQKRVFISSDFGNIWNELPEIINKNY